MTRQKGNGEGMTLSAPHQKYSACNTVVVEMLFCHQSKLLIQRPNYFHPVQAVAFSRKVFSDQQTLKRVESLFQNDDSPSDGMVS